MNNPNFDDRSTFTQIRDISIKSINDNNQMITGIPSGITKLDELTSGWQKSNSIILASYPGVGKTSFTINIIIEAIRHNIPVGIFKPIMFENEINERLICNLANVSISKYISKHYDKSEKERIKEASELADNFPLTIDDSRDLKMDYVYDTIDNLIKHKPNLGLIIIDDLQYVEKDYYDGMYNSKMTKISPLLKQYARIFDIPIISTIKIKQNVNIEEEIHYRDVGYPDIHVLEQDADVLITIKREKVKKFHGLDISHDEVLNNLNLFHYKLLLNKNRNGQKDKIDVYFDQHTLSFSESSN